MKVLEAQVSAQEKSMSKLNYIDDIKSSIEDMERKLFEEKPKTYSHNKKGR